MDFQHLLAELGKHTPSRDVVMQELDVIADQLRGGIDTTPYASELFSIFTKLINFSQWYIQQCTLSLTKYILENSTFDFSAKLKILEENTKFTTDCGLLLGNAKREVREMASQCLGLLTLQIGEKILDEKFGLHPALFKPPSNHPSLEGQQMALGRMATAFRIVHPESLETVLKYILDETQFAPITNPSENGYVYWYSTRALRLLVTTKLDQCLSQYKDKFMASRESIITKHRKEILDATFTRLGHQYANVRPTAAAVVAALLPEDRESYIKSFLPQKDDKWVKREGYLQAIAACIEACDSPFKDVNQFADPLIELVHDPIDCDKSPITQKGGANGWAGRALTQLLRQHPQIFETKVKPAVLYLLNAPTACLLDAGDICVSIIIDIGGFEIKDLLLRVFKNMCHASFPIRDLARRIVPAEEIVKTSLPQLIEVLAEYSHSKDQEVRESVCRAIQLVSTMTSEPLPPAVVEIGTELAEDSVDAVAAAAIDVLRYAMTADSAQAVPELVKTILQMDNDDSLVAAMKLMKHALNRFRSDLIEQAFAISPLLAFHTLASMSPAVSSMAQQLLLLIAGNSFESDQAIVDAFNELDIDSIGPDELEELVDSSDSNGKAPSTLLSLVINRFCDDLGGSDSAEIIESFDLGSDDFEDLLRERSVEHLATAMMMSKTLAAEQMKLLLQAAADIYADEGIDEKKALLLGLNLMRRSHGIPIFLPEPTPISTTHLQEGFAKGQPSNGAEA